eukprot:TRINITY_DN3127_c0_g1_i1.p1 TRINITY_DN3127_c0_g1~~TRINITY_DN3127_c0_g1_i1.p1  ORF type:complete len:881 (+),score=200.72 TRINITY_DN3127_c0_g1_i1:144-2786(+)
MCIRDSRYEGQWKNNMKHGEGSVYATDGSMFKGEYFNNNKHGKGKTFVPNGAIWEEYWEHGSLVSRDIKLVNTPDADKHSNNEEAERELLKSRVYEPLTETQEQEEQVNYKRSEKVEECKSLDPNNLGRNHTLASQSQNVNTETMMMPESEKMHFIPSTNFGLHHQNIVSVESMNTKTLGIGIETMDQMEMLNTLNYTLLNKPIKEWTSEDVCEWLHHVNLSEYCENFANNHITGKNLLDLSDNDLKNELQITSIGHRKDFKKGVEYLKKVYYSGSNYNAEVKQKMIKFFEKHKNKFNFSKRPSGLGMGPRSLISLGSHTQYYSNTVIDEENNSDDGNNSKGSPVVNGVRNVGPSVEEFKLDEDGKPRKRSSPPNNNLGLNEFNSINEGQRLTIMERAAEEEESVRNDDMSMSGVNIGRSEEELRINKGKSKSPTLEDFNGQNGENNVNGVEEGKDEALGKSNANLKGKSLKSTTTGDETTNGGYSNATNLNNNNNATNANNAESSSDSDSASSTDSEGDKKEKLMQKSSSAVVPTDDSILKLKKNNSKPNEHTKRRRPKEVMEKKRLSQDEEIIRALRQFGLGGFIIKYEELEFEKKVGEGGYGEVYKGVWLGQEVAIKQYGKRHTRHHTKKTEDFMKEVNVLSNLRHPNIVLYMGVCVNYTKCLMITEYLELGSLFDVLHKLNTKLSEDKMLNICEDIALGMTYLHGRKILHCDLKSSNILIDSNWNIKLCDFGLSTVKSRIDKRKKKKYGRIGTPHWMAPEILREEKYDESSDVYSYGMVLWEMVTCVVPYKGYSVWQIIASVGYDNKQVEIPKKGNKLILEIIRLCLNYEREKRPTFKQILEMLQNRNKEQDSKAYLLNQLELFFSQTGIYIQMNA